MVEIEAKIVRIAPGFAWITQESKGLCQYCNTQTGCKSIALSRLFCRKTRVFRVQDPLGVSIGEHVSVGVREKSLLQGAVMAYFLPLLSLLFGAIIGQYWGAEYGSIVGGIIGFACALYGLSRKNITQNHLPIIIKRIDLPNEMFNLDKNEKEREIL